MLRVLILCLMPLFSVPLPAWAAGWEGLQPEGAPSQLDFVPWRDWLVQIGPDHNTFPGGGNDPLNYFGTMRGSIDDYPDSWDVIDPRTNEHQLNLRFTGNEWGENPTYPPYNPNNNSKGLMWDVRMPYTRGYKVWRAEMVTEDPGYAYDLVWNLDPFPDFDIGIPPNFAFRLDMDGSFADEPAGDDPRWFDLDNYEIDLCPGCGGPEYIIEDLPQTGEIQVWYIIAGYETQPIGVPEPTAAAPMLLVLAAAIAARNRLLRR